MLKSSASLITATSDSMALSTAPSNVVLGAQGGEWSVYGALRETGVRRALFNSDRGPNREETDFSYLRRMHM